MLTIEEYIAKRKREDGLVEFDPESRMKSARLCSNYVFEYFDTYLTLDHGEQKTILSNK